MKKTRRTKEEVGRQHQGMDRPGVRQVPEGSGEQGNMEKTGYKIICGAPTTLAVKGLMMMTMMMSFEPIYIPRALNTGTCIRQGDLFYSAGLHRNHVPATANTGKIGRVLEKKKRKKKKGR